MKALRTTIESVSNMDVLLVAMLIVCINLDYSLVWKILGIGGSVVSVFGKLILQKRKKPFYEHCRDVLEKIVTLMTLSLIGYMSLLWLYAQTHEGVNIDSFLPPLLSFAFYTMICGVVYVQVDNHRPDEN
jgi:hypothetical protein